MRVSEMERGGLVNVEMDKQKIVMIVLSDPNAVWQRKSSRRSLAPIPRWYAVSRLSSLAPSRGSPARKCEASRSDCGREKKFKYDENRKIGFNEINCLQVLILAKIDFF